MSENSWRPVSLGDICEFKYGKSLPSDRRALGPYRVYGSNGPVGTHTSALTGGPTIVVGRKGSFGEVHYSSEPCWPIDTTYFIDETSTECDLNWLSRRLAALGLKGLNRAAAIPGLNREDAYRKELLLPPPNEQRRIAQVLDRVDALLVKRREAIALLDDLIQSIFLDMFGDPVSNQKSWTQERLCDLGSVVTGNTPPRAQAENYGDAIEWIKSDNISRDEIYLTEASERLSIEGMKKARLASPGSLLVTCIAGSPSSIGNVAVADRKVAFNQQINSFSPHGGNSLFYYFLLRLARPLILEKSTGGMKGLVSKSRFGSVILIDPPLALKERFSQVAESFMASRNAQRAHLAELDRLFVSVQHRAFRGELFSDARAA